MHSDSRIQPGTRFKSEVDGIPVILEIDEIVSIDKETNEAELRTHIVGTLEGVSDE